MLLTPAAHPGRHKEGPPMSIDSVLVSQNCQPGGSSGVRRARHKEAEAGDWRK